MLSLDLSASLDRNPSNVNLEVRLAPLTSLAIPKLLDSFDFSVTKEGLHVSRKYTTFCLI
jgi:hypothetical protein